MQNVASGMLDITWNAADTVGFSDLECDDFGKLTFAFKLINGTEYDTYVVTRDPSIVNIQSTGPVTLEWKINKIHDSYTPPDPVIVKTWGNDIGYLVAGSAGCTGSTCPFASLIILISYRPL